MRQATKLAEAGKLTPAVDPRRFSLDTLEDAFTAVASGQTSGKVVVEID
jgi:NADPH2:quinone reductase